MLGVVVVRHRGRLIAAVYRLGPRPLRPDGQRHTQRDAKNDQPEALQPPGSVRSGQRRFHGKGCHLRPPYWSTTYFVALAWWIVRERQRLSAGATDSSPHSCCSRDLATRPTRRRPLIDDLGCLEPGHQQSAVGFIVLHAPAGEDACCHLLFCTVLRDLDVLETPDADGAVLVAARTVVAEASRPACELLSARVHSRYRPSHGHLDRRGARIASLVGASVSRSTLLRMVRALPDPEVGQVTVLGGHGHPSPRRSTGRPDRRGLDAVVADETGARPSRSSGPSHYVHTGTCGKSLPYRPQTPAASPAGS